MKIRRIEDYSSLWEQAALQERAAEYAAEVARDAEQAGHPGSGKAVGIWHATVASTR